MVDVVVASGLTKYYGGRVGVVDVSFSLRRGEVLGYLGPNGSGKTTTIRLMLGFIRPSRGSVLVYGVSPSSGEFAGVKRFIGYVPEEFSFPSGLRGRDIVGYFSRMRGGAPRLRELLELFPLDLDRPVEAYSKGMRQMLALITALMSDPELIVLDEPATGLDPLMRSRLHELLRREARGGKAVFLSSHVLDEVERVADRVCFIKDGMIALQGDVRGIVGKAGKVVAAVLRRTPRPEELQLEGVSRLRISGNRVEMVVTGGYEEVLGRLLAYGIVDIEVRSATLEEVFLGLYERGGGG